MFFVTEMPKPGHLLAQGLAFINFMLHRSNTNAQARRTAHRARVRRRNMSHAKRKTLTGRGSVGKTAVIGMKDRASTAN